MWDWIFPLGIFPEGALASSVITTVWVGVFVIGFLNLRFGWVLSGLVVPGYLVPLLIAKPWAAAVILVEASVTYFLVWLFSERLSGGGTWSSLFGRDRFVGLVLFSILVRLVFDVWLLPVAGQEINDRFGLDFDWRNNLHSFGLIVISLLANQLWKPGFLRGMAQTLIILTITYLIVRLGLMELTNFRISGISYLYEGVASSILASPKAYVILITTALIASRMNLVYGWDFNGVLIPSLIALQWYEPLKVATSLIEAFVIYGLGSMLLRTPIFADVTMEGARKILLFFNVSFAYKLLLGHTLVWSGFDVKVTDYYGFGYLLSTLIAIKIHDKNILARLTRATLQVSLMGVAIGSLIGFVLTSMAVPTTWTLAQAENAPAPPIGDRAVELESLIAEHGITVYDRWRAASFTPPSPEEADAFGRGVRALLDDAGTGTGAEPGSWDSAARLLDLSGYRIERIAGGLIALTEREPGHGGGRFVIDPKALGDLLVSVPDPLAVPHLGEAAAHLFKATGARALAVAGASRSYSDNELADVTRSYQTLFQTFHEVVRGGTLQIRGATDPAVAAEFRVPSSLPDGLDPTVIAAMVKPLRTVWGPLSEENIQQETATAGFAELRLGNDAARRLIGQQSGGDAITLVTGSEDLEAHLRTVLDRPGIIADAESGAYVAPTLGQLVHIDTEILRPLLTEVVAGYRDGNWALETRDALAAAGAAARAVGYGLTVYRQEPSGRAHLVLAPRPDAVSRGWGVYALRLGPGAAAYTVQVPRAAGEANTLEFALALQDWLDASALLIAGAHPQANPDQSADLLASNRPAALFDLVSQSLLREAGNEPLTAVQARSFGVAEDGVVPPYDVLVASDRIGLGDGSEDPLTRRLVTGIETAGMSVGIVRGEPDTAGYELGRVPQSLYTDQTVNKRFIVLWLSPLLRAAYADRDAADAEEALFEALDIPTADIAPFDYAAGRFAQASGTGLPQDLRRMINEYLSRRDAIALRKAQIDFPGFRLERLRDPASRQSFLALLSQQGGLAALVNLSPKDAEGEIRVRPDDDPRAVIDRFVDTRTAWILPAGAPP